MFPTVPRLSQWNRMAALLLLGGAGIACAMPSRAPATGTAPSEAAEYGWRLREVSGGTIDFAAFRGRPVLMNVWATWCPPCVAELGSLRALRDSVAADSIRASVAFVFVAPEPSERVAAFLAKTGLDIPAFVEIDPVPGSYDVQALPTTIVIDRHGQIVLRHRGAADWNTPAMRDFLRELSR